MLEPGAQVGHYRIIRSLGSGGMADVYEAEDAQLGRRVALKILPPEFGRNPQLVARFEKEVRAAALLNHRNIVTVFEVGQQAGNHFYSMRLLTGGDLRARINRGMRPLEAMAILRELADAFAHAHARGFVHRDVKPENIVFDEQGFPVLTDFGIAKALDADTKMTGTGVAIGTPRYLSPEQARGRPVDARADIYSLGVVLYEMLTGHPPYDAEESLAVILKHLSDPIPRLPAALDYLQPLLDRLMAKEPDQRVRSATELIGLVDALQPRVRTAETPSASAVTMESPLVANLLTPSPLRASTAESAKVATPAPAAQEPAPPAAATGAARPLSRKKVASIALAGVLGVVGLAMLASPLVRRDDAGPATGADATPVAAPEPIPAADTAGTEETSPTAAAAIPVSTPPARSPEPPASAKSLRASPKAIPAVAPAAQEQPATAPRESMRLEQRLQRPVTEQPAAVDEAARQQEQREAAEQARQKTEAAKLEEQRKKDALEQSRREEEARRADAQKAEEQRKREAGEQARREEEARLKAQKTSDSQQDEERRREAARKEIRERPVEQTISPDESFQVDSAPPPMEDSQ